MIRERATAKTDRRPRQIGALGLATGLLLSLAVLPGCRSEMYDQARYEPYEATEFFADGTSARPLVAGTIPRRDPREQGNVPHELFTTGKTAGQLTESLPFPVDKAVLERGQDRYRIFCTPCHGELGDGRGMIVRRGFNAPPSFHGDELRKQPVGHYFDVMTRGHGTMYSYASRIGARDRWQIAAYIRALQLSQHAPAGELPLADRDRLEGVRP
jgi:mono/diheme cytochrome c family protein